MGVRGFVVDAFSTEAYALEPEQQVGYAVRT
jgi:hypothetical protein